MPAVSKVEIPRKKAPPKIDVLARQIEALKNDVPEEKRQEVTPRLSRLEEKIMVVQESRQKSAEELAKINAEFEKIREALELRNFFRRFEVSEKVARYLKAHPKKKIANLKPADFTDNPEFQETEVWKNIIEDAQKGLTVSKLLTREDFDWSDPEAYLEKADNIGKDVLDTIKRNPIIFGGFLIMGGIALYQFFKKDSKLIDKVGGLVAGGAAAYLGISLVKENFGSSAVSFLGRNLLGEENWKKVEGFFAERKREQAPEETEKYGRMMPLSDAIENYRKDAEDMLRPIVREAKINKDAIAILGAAGFLSSGATRNITLSSTKITAKSMLALTKLPIKAVKGFPITSLFAATAVLLSFEKIKTGVGEFQVPKDSKNMLKFLKAKIKDAGEKFNDLDIPAIPDAHLATIADVLTGQRSLKEFAEPTKKMLSGMAETGVEWLELTHAELIQKRNLTGLEVFRETIKGLEEAEHSSALAAIDDLILKIKNGGLITIREIEKIKLLIKPLGLRIRSEDGRLKVVRLDKHGVVHLSSICVDPTLSANKQFDVAKTFFIESDNWLEASGKLITTPVEQFRLALGGIFENVKTEAEVGEVIERKLREGWILTIVGGTLSIIAKGGVEKFILGPAEMIGNLWNLMPGGKEFSCVEMAIDYADGLLPVAVFGIANAITKKEWGRIFKGKVLLRSLIYPVEVPRMAFKHIVKPLISSRSPTTVLSNLNIQIGSGFKSFLHGWKARIENQKIKRVWLRGEMDVWEKAVHIRKISLFKKAISEVRLTRSPDERVKLMDKAREIINDTDLEKKFFGSKSIFKGNESVSNARLNEALEKCDDLIADLKAEKVSRSKTKPKKFDIPKKIKGLTLAQVRTEKIRVQFAITRAKNALPSPKSPDFLKKSRELQKLRNELAMLSGYLYPTRATGRAIDVAKIEKLSIDQRITRISEIAQAIKSSERGVSSRIAAEIKKLRANFIAGKLTKAQFQKELSTLDKISIRFAKNKVARFREIESIYKKIPRKAVTPGLKRQLKRSLDSADDSFVTRVVRGAKGRAKLAVLMASAMYAIDTAINWNNEERTLIKELQNFGPLMGQVLLDVAPFAGTLSNFYSAFSGEEYVTEMDVSGTWERASNVLWGCVGLAGDTVMVLTAIPSGGTSVGANAALRLSKIIAKGGRLAKPAKFLLKNWEAVARIADKSGGWVEFIRKVTNSRKVVSNLRRVEKAGMATGTLMLGGSAVNLVYGFLSDDESSEMPTFD